MPTTAKELVIAEDSVDERISSVETPRRAKASSTVTIPSGVLTPQSVVLPSGRAARDTPTRKQLIEELGISPKKGAFGREVAATIPIPARVEKVYKLIKKTTGTIGGNGYDGAIYGELTMGSMQRIVNIMVEKCGLSSDSRFIDVGSGLGKPNFHVAQYPGVRLSIGIELESIRWKLAMHNMSRVLPAVSPEWTGLNSSSDTHATGTSAEVADIDLYGGVNFLCGDMDDAASTVCKFLPFFTIISHFVGRKNKTDTSQVLHFISRTPLPTCTCTTWAFLHRYKKVSHRNSIRVSTQSFLFRIDLPDA
jgi:hypothetical protein